MISTINYFADSPRKAERVIFFSLKILVTVWLANLTLGTSLSISSFSLVDLTYNLKVQEAIYYILCAVGYWILVWEICLELIVDWAVSKMAKQIRVIDVLEFLFRISGAVVVQEGKITETKNHILFFTEQMNEDAPSLFAEDPRASQYFNVGLLCCLVLSTTSISIQLWQIFTCWFIAANLLVITVMQRCLHLAYENSRSSLESLLYPLGKQQMLHSSIEQLPFLEKNYNIRSDLKRVTFQRKTNISNLLPEHIVIFKEFHSNTQLGSSVVGALPSSTLFSDTKSRITVIVSNTLKFQGVYKEYTPNIVQIGADTEKEMFEGLQLLIRNKLTPN